MSRTLTLLVLTLISVDAAAQEHNWRSAERANALANSQYSSFLTVVKKVELLKSVSYRVGLTLPAGEFHKLFAPEASIACLSSNFHASMLGWLSLAAGEQLRYAFSFC